MSLVATALAAHWTGWDLDLTVRVRNTSPVPTTVGVLWGTAWREGEPFGAIVADPDPTSDPLDPEDPPCARHWLPWRSSLRHVLRVGGIGFLPDHLRVEVSVRDDPGTLDVDLSRVTID